MGYTVQDRDALKQAIAMGVKSVSFSDRRQEYRSLDEMKATLAMIEAELSPKKNRNGRRYAICSSGVRT